MMVSNKIGDSVFTLTLNYDGSAFRKRDEDVANSPQNQKIYA